MGRSICKSGGFVVVKGSGKASAGVTMFFYGGGKARPNGGSFLATTSVLAKLFLQKTTPAQRELTGLQFNYIQKS
jgi:hypothetical protein